MPLRVDIQATDDFWDNVKEEFVSVNKQTLILEHSLVSISKWEAKNKKAFFSNNNKTIEELKDYIRCMTINNVDEKIYDVLAPQHYEMIRNYIEDPMSATYVSSIKRDHYQARKNVTSEMIYYSMFTYGIPLECEKWHINRLMKLIEVFNAYENPHKMSKRDSGAWQRAENAKRLKRRNH
jgi:hypothetical protein